MTIFAAATCKGRVCRLFFPINNMPTIIIIRFELTRPVHLSAFRGNQFKNKNAAVRKLSARRSKKKCPAPWIFFFLKKEEKERKLLCLLLTDWLLLSVACGQCRQWTLKFYFIKFSFFLLYVCLSGGVDDESVYIFVVVSPDTFFQGGITTSVARQREWTTRLSRYNFAERIRHSTNGRETCGPFKIARHSNSFCSCTHRRFIYLKRTGVYTHNHDRDDAI